MNRATAVDAQSSGQSTCTADYQEHQEYAALVARAKKIGITLYPRLGGTFLFHTKRENGDVEIYECNNETTASGYLTACEEGTDP